MSTPSKQKITAIRTYLLNKVHDVLTKEAEAAIDKEVAKHSVQYKKLERLAAKIKVLQTELKAEKTILETNIKDTGVYLTFNTPESYSSQKNGIYLLKHNNAYAYGNSNTYSSGYYCTITQFEKAKAAVKEIDNYCLELQISPDLADIETFATSLIKGLKK